MLKLAVQNLMSRPTRSLLALLGLTVAIMGMVGLFSVAVGIGRTIDETFKKIPGLAAMQPGAPIPLFSRLPASWAVEMESVPGVRTVRPEVWVRAQMVNGKATFNPPRFVFGTDIGRTLSMKSAVFRDDMVAGRFLTPEDRGTLNCVISLPIANDAKKKVGDPLKVDGNTFNIVGIYSTKSIMLDVAIILDERTVRQRYHFEDNFVSSVYIEPDGSVSDEVLADRLRDTFRGRSLASYQASDAALLETVLPQSNTLVGKLTRGLIRTFGTAAPAAVPDAESTGDEPGIEVRSSKDWGERIAEFSADLDIFLYLMNMIGVVIALLSILNTMLMSVSERMVEFGVLKANGWTSGDLLKLITYESALLGLCGGLVGCALGWAGTELGNYYYPNKLNLYASPGLLGFSLLFSVVLGVFGGLYPAWWATRLTPMEAIRH